MEIQIRPFVPADWSSICKIYLQAVEEGGSTFQTEAPDFSEWDKAHLDCCRFVAETDGQVIGWCALSPVNSRLPYRGVAEVSIYIDRNHRKLKIGEKLLNYLCAESEKCGIWSLCSIIIENNLPSTALHQKCGFRLVGYREKIAKDRFGQWQNTLLYEKRSKVVL